MEKEYKGFLKINLFSVISFLIVENSIIAVMLSDKSYSLVSHAILFVFLLSFLFVKKININYFKYFIGTFLFLSLGIFIHFIHYRDYTFLYLFTIPQSLLIGFVFFLNFKNFPSRFLFYFNLVLFLLFVFIFTEDGNTETFKRTTYTTILCHFWFLEVFQQYLKHKKVGLLSTYCFFIISVVSYSRIGISVSLLVLVASQFTNIRKNIKKFVTLSIIGAIIVLLFVILFDFKDVPAFERFQRRGLGTGRYEFWEWYITKQNIKEFLIGSDQFEVWSNLNRILKNPDPKYTLHNSFLQFHSFVGAFAIVIFLMFFTSAFMWFRKNRDLVLFTVFIGYMGIAFFSTIMLPQRYDYVFFALLFLFKFNRSRTSYLNNNY
ncbi:MAG: hypothetical protein OIF50_07655 [Flavobacteriaceae bacterium]|nr:hypothetical protein [Flavobacteriaceae bacterium]